MASWGEALRRGLVSGAAASVASTLVLAASGRRELRDPATPLNAPSQWVWGTHAPHVDGFTARHTVVGYAVHHLAATFWAVLYEKLRPPGRPGTAALATAAVAGIVDFRVVPERLTPGFQRRLSRGAIAMSYVAFAIGLALRSIGPSPRPSPEGRGRTSPGEAYSFSVSSGTTWNRSPTRP